MDRPQTEVWKPIPDFEGRYEASSLGKIRRVTGKRCHEHPVLIANFAGDGGYIRTAIMRNGKIYKPGVHVLIAAAFLGPCPDGYEVNHLDMDKTNNRPENLEYVSHADNLQHAREKRPWHPPRGANNPQGKLSNADVLAIRRSGLSQRQLASQYGVSQVAIHYVKTGKTYRDIGI